MKTTIDTTKYTRHPSPGKFEGETAATEYFYEQMMNGDGDTIYDTDYQEFDESDYPEATYQADLFNINAEEAEAFDLPIGATFMIREDSQGFVYGSVHANSDAAEKKFRVWLGL